LQLFTFCDVFSELSGVLNYDMLNLADVEMLVFLCYAYCTIEKKRIVDLTLHIKNEKFL